MNLAKVNLKWIIIGLAVVLAGVLTTSYYMAEPLMPAPISPAPVPVTLTPQSSSSTQPKITWSGKQIEMVLSPGESATKTLTFTSTQNLQNVVIEAIPKIAPFLSIQPTGFPAVTANQPQQVQVSFAIPTTATLGDYDGTIHVRTGSQTLAQTVKVALKIWQAFSNQTLSVEFKFPPNLAVATRDSNEGLQIIAYSPTSPEHTTFVLQVFPIGSVPSSLLDIAVSRFGPEAIRSSTPLGNGILVEYDGEPGLSYFQYSPTSGRVAEVYAWSRNFFNSPDFTSLLSTMRF